MENNDVKKVSRSQSKVNLIYQVHHTEKQIIVEVVIFFPSWEGKWFNHVPSLISFMYSIMWGASALVAACFVWIMLSNENTFRARALSSELKTLTLFKWVPGGTARFLIWECNMPVSVWEFIKVISVDPPSPLDSSFNERFSCFRSRIARTAFKCCFLSGSGIWLK